MAKFRYKGATVHGEKADGDGNIVPNIVESTEVYGYQFHKKSYTEVPDDQVAYYAQVMNNETGARSRQPCLVVDKLRANSHFEEQAA